MKAIDEHASEHLAALHTEDHANAYHRLIELGTEVVR